jgi:hypothetical protein
MPVCSGRLLGYRNKQQRRDGKVEIGERPESPLVQKAADSVTRRARPSQAHGKGQRRSVDARNLHQQP